MDAFAQAFEHVVELERAGNYQEAFNALQAMAQTFPQSAPVRTHIAAILLIWEKTQEALSMYDQALQLDARDAYAWEGKARCLFSLERSKEALAAADQALALKPHLPEALCVKGQVLAASDDARSLNSALAYFDQVLRLNPNHASAMIGKAKTFSVMGRYDDALMAGQRAVQLNPNSTVAWRVCAISQWERREFDAALYSLDRAFQLGADDDGIWTLQGGILRNKYAFVRDPNLLDRAIAAFDRALAHNPSDRETLKEVIKARQECVTLRRRA